MAHEATIRGVGISTGKGGPGPPAVLLDGWDEIIPIFIDPAQAATIEQGRQDLPVERPMTHDLFVGVVDDLHGTLDQVRIDALARSGSDS